MNTLPPRNARLSRSGQKTGRDMQAGEWHAGRLPLLIGVMLACTWGCAENEKADISLRNDHAAVNPAGADAKVVYTKPSERSREMQPGELADAFSLAKMATRQDEECCSDPGAIADCWWQDADRDGVTCVTNSDCNGSNTCDMTIDAGGIKPPNGWGLCTCSDDGDCASGVCQDGHCGPSFCNGYSVCSCWGGCTDANTGSYGNPEEMCTDVDSGYPGECCEGNYPKMADGSALGFCSDSCGGGGPDVSSCTVDADCVDPLPDPYSADCVQYFCDQGTCRLDYINADGDCSDNVKKSDPSFWGSAVRDEGGGNLSCFVGRCDAIGKCLSDPAPADTKSCDEDDSNLCTVETCLNGVCDHDFSGTDGNDCANDTDACTLETCNAGVCQGGGAKTCADFDTTGENYCTINTCQNKFPAVSGDFTTWECVSTDVADGMNAADYAGGYPDTAPCMDIICYGGVEDQQTTDCTGYDPYGYGTQCNTYSCDTSGAEDNCDTLTVSTGGCNDGDLCSDTDQCVTVSDHGECQGTPIVCDDLNPCTNNDGCSGGVCQYSFNSISCDDGNACTQNETCSAGTCTGGTAVTCPFDTVNYDEECASTTCNTTTGCGYQFVAATADCDDDTDPNECSLYKCNGSGKCNVLGSTVTCTDPDTSDCLKPVCDTADGMCDTNITLGPDNWTGNPPWKSTPPSTVLKTSFTVSIDGPGAGDLTYASGGSTVYREDDNSVLGTLASPVVNYHDRNGATAGWQGSDHIWKINYSAAAGTEVVFSGCSTYGATGSFDSRLALYDCSGALVAGAEDNDGCSVGGMARITTSSLTAGKSYYLVMDADVTTAQAYKLAIYYTPKCNNGVQDGTETGVDCGGSCSACPSPCPANYCQNDTHCTGTNKYCNTSGSMTGGCYSCIACPSGKCKSASDCAAATPTCNTTAPLDSYGCGVCQAAGVPTCTPPVGQAFQVISFADDWSAPGDDTQTSSPVAMNGGCAAVNAIARDFEFNELKNAGPSRNKIWGLQLKDDLSATEKAKCSFPLKAIYKITFCRSLKDAGDSQGNTQVQCSSECNTYTLSDYSDTTEMRSDIQYYCASTGTITGTVTWTNWWEYLYIPLRRFTTAVSLSFNNPGSTCKANFGNKFLSLSDSWTDCTCPDQKETSGGSDRTLDYAGDPVCSRGDLNCYP